MTSRLSVNSLQWMCANIAASSSKGGATKRRLGSSNIWSGFSKKPNSLPSEQPSAQLYPVVNIETSSNNAIKPNLSDAIESTSNSFNVINKSSSKSSISIKTSFIPIKTFSDSPKSENYPSLKLSKAKQLYKRDVAANFKRDTQSIHHPTTKIFSVRHSTPPQLMRGAYRGRGRRARGGRIEPSQTSSANCRSTASWSTDDGSSVRRSSRLASRPKRNFTNQNPIYADHLSCGARRSPRTQLASPSSSGVEDTTDLASSPSISASQQVVKAIISNVDTNESPAPFTSSPNSSLVSARQSPLPTEADELKSSRRVAPRAEVLYFPSPPSTLSSIQEPPAAPSSTSLSQTALRATPTSSSSQQPSYISASASQKSAQSTCLTSSAPSSSKSHSTQSVPEPKFTRVKSHSALPKSLSASTSTTISPKRSLTTRSASGIARYNPRHWQLGESEQEAGRDVDEEGEENAEASAEDDMRSSSSDFDDEDEDDEDDEDEEEEVDYTRHLTAATQSHSHSQPASSKRTAEAAGPRSQVKFLSSARILDRLLQ